MKVLFKNLKYLVLKECFLVPFLFFFILTNGYAFAYNRRDNESHANKVNLVNRVNGVSRGVVNLTSNKLKRDYEFIFFYSTNCPHCLIFDPVLKLYSDNSGIPVKAFVFGGVLLPSFPDSTVLSQEIVDQFFGRGAMIGVPALFILNKRNLHAYPVSRGALTDLELAVRMNELTPKILQNEQNERNYKKY